MPDVRTVFPVVSKMLLNLCLLQTKSSKRSSGDVESGFDNPAQVILSKVWKKGLKTNLKQKQLQKRNYIKMFLWTCWIQFSQLCWSFFVKCPITFRASSENSQKFWFFKHLFFLLKMLLGTRRKYFRQPWQFFLAQSLNSFRAISKKILEIKFLPGKVIDSNCSSGDVESSFYNPAEVILPEVWKSFAKIWERVWRSNKFKKYLPQIAFLHA